MTAIAAARRRVTRPDYLIALVVALLTGVGLVFVYSASFAIGLRDYDNVNFFVARQAIGATIGAVAMFVLAQLDYHVLGRWSPLILLAALAGLGFVLIPGLGIGAHGSQRWIALGPLPPVQPSEFAKLAMVIYIAAWLAAKGDQVTQFSLGVVPFVLMVGLVGGLIMLQPDMGTFLVIVLTTSTMFFVAGAAIRHVFTLAAAGLATGALLIVAEGYRLERWKAFINAEDDPEGRGFQILQLLIALGSGGVRGLGIGESRQKFFYVPAAHTDGIFAIVGEELGFIGACLVLALFITLVYRGFRTAFRARDEFGYLLAVGVTCWIAYQTVINLGGVTRSLPLTGIPLPFLSYGNSALIATLAAVGVLLSVSRAIADGPYLARRHAPDGPRPGTTPPPHRRHSRGARGIDAVDAVGDTPSLPAARRPTAPARGARLPPGPAPSGSPPTAHPRSARPRTALSGSGHWWTRTSDGGAT